MSLRAYVVSQRLSYLALGGIIGFILALNESPLDYYLIFGFVLLAVILSYIVKRR